MAQTNGKITKEEASLTFSLVDFERKVYSGRTKEALECLKSLLVMAEMSYGGLSGSDIDSYMASRLTCAITALFSNPRTTIHFKEYSNLMIHYQWLTVLFGVSPFRHSDHIIQCLSKNPEQGIDIPPKELMKCMLFWSMDSNLDFPCEALWNASENIAGALFMAQMGCRLAISDKAFNQKNKVLKFLAEKLKPSVLAEISFGNMTDLMMHVDYATEPRRYEVKRKIASFIHETFKQKRIAPYMRNAPIPANEKPRLLVVFDWYHNKHVVHRAMHAVISRLREKFHVTGLIINTVPAGTDIVPEVVDEVVRLDSQHMGTMLDEATKRIAAAKPDAIFYPGIGLSQMGVMLANLRLAKVQITSHGHPSSSCSTTIDYFIVEEGYREATKNFSEKVIYVPDRSFPQTKQHDHVYPKTKSGPKNSINIAVSLSLMKINPLFLRTCQRIQEERPEVVFHIMVGVSYGLSKDYADYHIHHYLPKAIVYGNQPLEDYLKTVANCDMFIVPFPFGNSNAMLDCIMQSIPGICMDGDQIYSHMAAFYMDWLGCPESLLISKTESEYEANVIFLCNQLQTVGRSLPDGLVEYVYDGTPMNVVNTMDKLVRGEIPE